MSQVATRLKLDPNSEKAFAQAMRYAADNSPQELGKILDWAAVNYVQSARKATPAAKKSAKREVVRGGRGRWSALVLTQTRPPKPVPIYGARSRSEALRSGIAKVPRVGAARGSWWGCLRDLRKTQGQRGPDTSSAHRLGNRLSPAIEIVNKLRYLLKIAPAIDAIAKANAAKQVVVRIERYLDKHGFRRR